MTLATVEAAKGYDSPIVFLMGVDLFGENVEARARFYVGATRAKMHLFVTGVRGRGGLAEEAEAVSKLLTTNAPTPVSLSTAVDHWKDVPIPKPNRAAPAAAASRRVEFQTPSRPAASTSSVLQAFAPRFRRGATVQHPRYGIGKVVRDGVRKYLSSQDRWDENVRVQFGGTIKKLEAGSDGLVLLQHKE